MRIVYCLPQVYRPGGIERIVSIKANYLADVCGYEVFIVTACQQGKPSFYRFSKNVKFVDLDVDHDATLTLPLWKRVAERRRKLRCHKRKLAQLLNDIKPDITISTFTHEAAFLPDIKDGSKKVLEFHFCKGHKRKMADAFGFPLPAKQAYYFKCWMEENIIIPKYDQFVVLTKEDKADWAGKVPTVEYIPNILPFETEEQAKLENKRAIAVGRLDAQKRFDRLIVLWKDIHAKHPDWRLDIFGQGRNEQKLQALITGMGLNNTILIHKPCQKIKEEYLASSIFVMTSAYEGLPMTLLEATELGLPAVCYDFKCGPKDVIVNGKNGFIVKDGNAKDFVESVCRLIEDETLRKELGNGAKVLSARYSREAIMQKWMDLFNKITEAK